jgi:hypothetical protein
MKWCWILSKAFSVSIKMIKWIFFLLLLMCCVKFVDLHHPWDEADLVMVNHFSDMLLDSVCHYFIEDFYIDLH